MTLIYYILEEGDRDGRILCEWSKFTDGASLNAFVHLENDTKFAPRHFWMKANCAFGYLGLCIWRKTVGVLRATVGFFCAFG